MRRLLPKLRYLLLLGAVGLAILAAACAESQGTKPTIKLAENDWTSQIIEIEILDQVVTKQLGYPTERVKLAVSATWPAICKGDADIEPEVWLPGRQAEIQPFLDQGCVELGNQIFPGTGTWVVPKFVVSGDPARGIAPMAPNLKYVSDLKKYWKLFENPEKTGMGELVGGSPGWIDDPMDRSMIKGYDLPFWRSNQTEPVMMARMIAETKKGKPLLMYIWTPHWIFAEVDLVKLEWPDPWSDDCFKKEGDPYKCPHPSFDVRTVVSPKLKDKAPDVYQMVKNMQLGEPEINELMLRVDVKEESIKEVAADWISKNQARIDAWLGK